MERVRKAFKILRESYTPTPWLKDLDSFRILVAIILSSRTHEANVKTAFKSLEERFGIDPFSLSEAEVADLENCLRSAGLFKVKARCLKEISQTLVTEYEGVFDKLLEGDVKEVRQRLIELPCVGGKTADVVLAFTRGEPVMAVDTHVRRISKRLRIIKG